MLLYEFDFSCISMQITCEGAVQPVRHSVRSYWHCSSDASFNVAILSTSWENARQGLAKGMNIRGQDPSARYRSNLGMKPTRRLPDSFLAWRDNLYATSAINVLSMADDKYVSFLTCVKFIYLPFIMHREISRRAMLHVGQRRTATAI